MQRLLRKIENKKLRQAVAEVVIPKDHIEIGEIIGHGKCPELNLVGGDSVKRVLTKLSFEGFT